MQSGSIQSRARYCQASSDSEGLAISNFEQDSSIWQGYAQSTETQIKSGATPPEGYINVGKYHAKYTERWVKPMPGFVASKEPVKEGQTSGKWDSTVENDRIVAIDIPHDWTGGLLQNEQRNCCRILELLP